mgnify:CR=1 FL=1
MDKPLWSPSSESVKGSLLTRFTKEVTEKRELRLENYSDLHSWSVRNPDQFWSDYWEFSEIRSSEKSGLVVENLHQFPGARWFPTRPRCRRSSRPSTSAGRLRGAARPPTRTPRTRAARRSAGSRTSTSATTRASRCTTATAGRLEATSSQSNRPMAGSSS